MDEEDYWHEAHIGFNFDDDVSLGGNTSLVKRSDNLQLLKCDGLNEATESISSVSPSSHIVCLEEDKHVQKIAKKYNPLESSVKEKSETTKLSASQTVRNMILGLNYSLQSFKGKENKIELLKAAVQSHDGNAIITVLLFLKNTLKKSIFQREIGRYTDAVNMYLSYLEEDHEIDELTNMYLLMDNSDAAAMVKYTAALALGLPDRKIKAIDNCLSTHFQSKIVDDFLCASVIEHKQLLRDQVAIKDYHLAASPEEKDQYKLFQQLTNETQLVDTSVMCSLIFCSLFYYKTAEVAFISPAYVRNTYNLSKKQFTWGAVRALIAVQNWLEMQELFISKSWIGGTKVKSCINLSEVLRFLSKMQAPHEIISKYVCHVENQELKLSLAKKYNCHSVVIEILKNNRNRIELLEYKSTLPPHSVDFCTAADILNNKNIKWRN